MRFHAPQASYDRRVLIADHSGRLEYKIGSLDTVPELGAKLAHKRSYFEPPRMARGSLKSCVVKGRVTTTTRQES